MKVEFQVVLTCKSSHIENQRSGKNSAPWPPCFARSRSFICFGVGEFLRLLAHNVCAVPSLSLRVSLRRICGEDMTAEQMKKEINIWTGNTRWTVIGSQMAL